MTADTQGRGIEACRRWAVEVGLSDDAWQARTGFVAGYEIAHREALEQGIVQEMLEVLERLAPETNILGGLAADARAVLARIRGEETTDDE